MNKLLTAALGLAVAVLPVLAASPAFAADAGPDTRACENAKVAEAEALTKLRDAKDDRQRFKLAAETTQALEVTIGKLTVTTDGVVEVSAQEKSDLAGLANQVDRLEKKRDEAVEKREEKCADPEPEPTPTPTPTPTTTPPVDNDVDCDEVSDARAQEILDADRNDPNNLDDDNDGVACEEEEALVADNDVVVTPGGGVNTGGWRR